MNPHIEGTEYQRPLKHYRVGSLEQKKINSANKKDTVFYTDGKTNILLRVGAIVPEGFHRGCTQPEDAMARSKESLSKLFKKLNKERKGTKYRKHGEHIIKWKE